MGGIKGQYDCIKEFSEVDYTQDLKKIDVPTLIVHGDDDQIVPIADSSMFSASKFGQRRSRLSSVYRRERAPGFGADYGDIVPGCELTMEGQIGTRKAQSGPHSIVVLGERLGRERYRVCLAG